MTVEGVDWMILKGRRGVAHGFKQANGSYLLCKRNAALCVACKEHGVPVADPDPFEVAIALMRKHWDDCWFELERYPSNRDDEVLHTGMGIHIVARTEDRKDSTVLLSFGSDPAARLAVSAIVAIHNEKTGHLW